MGETRAPSSARKSREHFGGEGRSGWALAAPAVLGLVLFIVLPFLLSLALSFTDYSLSSPLPWRFVGLRNYERLFTDPGLWRALLNNLLFVAMVVPAQTALALALALLLDRPLRGMTAFRTLFFMPVVYPMALVSVVWGLIFAPGEQGPMNQVLHTVTFGAWDPATDVLHDETLALPAIAVMSVWQGVGFQMVIMLAGLQGIPRALYESAAVDRAGRWQQFWHVTLPQMRNTIVFVALVTTILAFRLFDQVWILTRGGPEDATTTLLHEAYVATRERNQIGLGSAITVFFCGLVCVTALVQHRLLRREGRG